MSHWCRGPVLVLCSLLALWCGVGDAGAGIGQTVGECEEQYGEVVGRFEARLMGSDDQGLHFKKDYHHYYVEFRNGRAWWIRLVKRNLSNAEREVFFGAEGVRWEGPEEYGGNSYWISDRGQLHACQSDHGKVKSVEIMTREVVKVLRKAQERRQLGVGKVDAADFYKPASEVKPTPESGGS